MPSLSDAPRSLRDVDVVIIAGGEGSRLGGISKPELEVGGMSLLDRTLAAVDAARAMVIVGGPRRDGVAWTVEEPPGGGPAAAVAAGIDWLAVGGTGSSVYPGPSKQTPSHPALWTLVLAVDTPLAAHAIGPLVRVAAGDGAWMVDSEGREQPLLAIYRTESLAVRTGGTQEGKSMRSLVKGLAMIRVADVQGHSRDVDTWEDAHFFEERGLGEEHRNG